jgi:hypothetical protein
MPTAMVGVESGLDLDEDGEMILGKMERQREAVVSTQDKRARVV